MGGIGGVGVGGVSSGGLIPGGGHSSSSMRKSLQKHVSKRDRRYMNYAAEKNGSHSRMFPLHAQFGVSQMLLPLLKLHYVTFPSAPETQQHSLLHRFSLSVI